MLNIPEASADMSAAELRIREAMQGASPGARCQALINAYYLIRESERDAFVAVLAARLTLVRPADDPAPQSGAA